MHQKAAPLSPATLSLPKSGILFWLLLIQSRVSWWQPRLPTSLCFLKHKHLRSPQCLKTFPITDMIKFKFFTQLSESAHAVVMVADSAHDGPCILPLHVLYPLLRTVFFSHWSSSSGVSSSWKHLTFPVWVTSLLCTLGSLPACNTL